MSFYKQISSHTSVFEFLILFAYEDNIKLMAYDQALRSDLEGVI